MIQRRHAVWRTLLLLFPALAFGDIELPQADGSTLTLETPAQRIVALAPNITELLFAIGAGERLLATAEYSDYPPEATTVPRIGDAFRFDLERILALRPELVIGWESGNPATALTGLEGLGLKVWRTEVSSPDAIANLMEALGRATGSEATANEAAVAFRNRLAALRDRYADRPSVSYFYQVAARPLYTVNGQHLLSQGLATCGASNLFDDLPNLAPQIAVEAVLAGDPQVFFAPAIPGQDDPLAQWREWPNLRAVREDALLTLPADPISRATPRLLDAVELACGLLDRYRAAQSPRAVSMEASP
jgi:iron complex transport system substrate-binding protein